MCGDYYCRSCGPAQGNHRCEICGKWTADGGCDDPQECDRLDIEYQRELDEIEARMEEREKELWR